MWMFGNAGQFIDPLVFGVVFGCVLVMAWIQNGKSSFGLAFAALPSCGRDPFADSGENATFMRRRIDFILREQGFIGLERLSSEDPFVTKFRRHLTHDLACVQQGVKSLNGGKGDNNVKNLLTSLQSELDLILEALGKEDSRPDDLFKAIQPPAARLETTVRQL